MNAYVLHQCNHSKHQLLLDLSKLFQANSHTSKDISSKKKILLILKQLTFHFICFDFSTEYEQKICLTLLKTCLELILRSNTKDTNDDRKILRYAYYFIQSGLQQILYQLDTTTIDSPGTSKDSLNDILSRIIKTIKSFEVNHSHLPRKAIAVQVYSFAAFVAKQFHCVHEILLPIVLKPVQWDAEQVKSTKTSLFKKSNKKECHVSFGYLSSVFSTVQYIMNQDMAINSSLLHQLISASFGSIINPDSINISRNSASALLRALRYSAKEVVEVFINHIQSHQISSIIVKDTLASMYLIKICGEISCFPVDASPITIDDRTNSVDLLGMDFFESGEDSRLNLEIEGVRRKVEADHQSSTLISQETQEICVQLLIQAIQSCEVQPDLQPLSYAAIRSLLDLDNANNFMKRSFKSMSIIELSAKSVYSSLGQVLHSPTNHAFCRVMSHIGKVYNDSRLSSCNQCFDHQDFLLSDKYCAIWNKLFDLCTNWNKCTAKESLIALVWLIPQRFISKQNRSNEQSSLPNGILRNFVLFSNTLQETQVDPFQRFNILNEIIARATKNSVDQKLLEFTLDICEIWAIESCSEEYIPIFSSVWEAGISLIKRDFSKMKNSSLYHRIMQSLLNVMDMSFSNEDETKSSSAINLLQQVAYSKLGGIAYSIISHEISSDSTVFLENSISYKSMLLCRLIRGMLVENWHIRRICFRSILEMKEKGKKNLNEKLLNYLDKNAIKPILALVELNDSNCKYISNLLDIDDYLLLLGNEDK